MSAVSIHKTPAGTWKVRWRDATGAHSRTFRLKDDAKDYEADLRRGVAAATSGGRITVKAWSEMWLDSAVNLGPGGRQAYTWELARIIPALGDLRLVDVTAARVSRFLADEAAAGYAPSTVHRRYRTLRRMFGVAVAQGRLAANPCAQVDPPRVPRSEMLYLTAEELDRLAGAVADRYVALVLVAGWGGLRWSELVGLRRRNVDDGRVHVREQLVWRTGTGWDRCQPKTDQSVRSVTLPRSVADTLDVHLAEFTRADRDALVFTNGRGGPLGSSSFRSHHWKPALERADVDPALRFHDLRHTAVALAIAAGAHPKSIQARMGHSSITVTLDRYGHLFPDLDDRLADALDALRS